MITTVFLDVGEVLVDESRLWRVWAEWLDVPVARFMHELERVIEERRHHREVFQRLCPGIDIEDARTERLDAGWPPDIADGGDLYPDALPCLHRLREHGFVTGIAGNQPPGIEEALRSAGLDADILASSSTWGVSKPAPGFFRRIVEAAGVPAASIAYVGDRLDNDVLPAIEAGMAGVFLRRGPWAGVHAKWPEAGLATLQIHSLDELPAAFARIGHTVDGHAIDT